MTVRRRVVLAALAGVLLGAAPASAQERSFSDLGPGAIAVQGTSGAASVFVPVAPGSLVAGGRVELRFDHSPLLRADRSTLTVSAGGVPLDSVRLTRANARGGVLRATLPALPDARGGFSLEARFSMRMTRDPCEDPRNAGLWARVRASSSVAPRLRPAPRTLATALATLVPVGRGAQLDVALGARPSRDALAAAGTVAGAVGRRAAVRGADPLLRVVDAPVPGRPAVALAEGPAAPGAAPRPGQGALAVAVRGAPLLSVGGGDGTGLRRAAAAIATRAVTPFGGRRALVDALPTAVPAAARPWRRSAASFAQLGLGRREVSGTGATTVDLVVDRPPQWRITEGAVLDLVVDGGAGLRPDASSVSVRVAGRDVGSRRLQPGRGPVHLRFDLDAGLIDTDLSGRAIRRLPIAVRFDLSVEQRACTPVEEGVARAVLLDTSTITLPHEQVDALDLSRVPAPVAGPGRTATVVLPEAPTRGELTAGLQLAAAVGRWADPQTPLPRVLTTDRLGEDERSGHDLLLVGDAARELGEAVRAPDGARPAGHEGMVVVADSPWGDGHRVLDVTGGDEAGLVLAARAVTRAELVGRLSGRAMRVTPAAVQALGLADPGAAPPAELSPILERGAFDRIPVWAVPAGVVLVALLTIGGLISRRRWGGRRA